MTLTTIKQNLVYIATAIIVFLIVLAIRPSYSFQPTGIILPAVQEPLTPSHAVIQLYTAMPEDAKKLAYIHLEGHSLEPTHAQEQTMLDSAKKMTQKAGGDGLVISYFGYEGPSADMPAPLSKFVLMGMAIKVSSKSE